MRSKFIYLLFCITFLYSCTNHDHRSIIQSPVEYSVLKKSAFFNEKNISFTIDSAENVLYIHLTVNILQHFPFPVNRQYKDTLHKTVFLFELYHNGKIIASDYPIFKNTFRYFKDSSAAARNLCFTSDTIDLSFSNDIEIKVPFYAFHELKKGKQTIELAMSQSLFTDEARVMNKDSSYNYCHIYATKPLLNARVKFDINMPPIYKSIVYGQGLVLRNDSTFSPSGMDNTLWKSSYPDIYWNIFYPKNEFYVQTPYEESTDRYTAHDTFNLYHYYQNDSVGFGVYDHDNLSRDDGMGYWWGSLNDLTKSEYKRLAFDDVHHFDLKVKETGMIN